MSEDLPLTTAPAIQDHSAYLAGRHDFQMDIDSIVESDMVPVILETVMLATDMRFAAVARVTADRWVACRTVDEIQFGIDSGDEIEIRSTFCQTVRDTAKGVLFNDSSTDEVYGDHPIAAKFGIVSYASIPIFRSDGSFFGTLCAIDTEPRDIKQPRAVAMLEMFADLIGRSLETEEKLYAEQTKALEAREVARIQEEFVAILGHDLRSPVAAFGAGLRRLEKETQTERGQQILPMLRAPLRRMHELIDNLMMHARSRLGGGIRIEASPDAPIAEAITEVVDEIRAVSPDCTIEIDLSFDRPVACDAPRVAQAVSNLVSNAVQYCEPDTAVEVRGWIEGEDIVVSVANRGEIPDELRGKMFTPYRRGDDAMGEGLGLGLYIASSIAAAHDGRIDMTSENGMTTFELRFPA